jgi:hypothetical protein
LIGAALLGTAAVMQQVLSGTRPHIHRGRNSHIRERKAFPWVLAVYVVLTLYLAAPTLGTNAGGFITAVAAFGVVWLRHRQWTVPAPNRRSRGHRIKLALVVALVLAAAIALFALINAGILLPSGRESHIGRALRNLADGHTDLIGSMIVRKLAMNWHLLKASIWSKVLLSSLLVISVLLLKPQGVFRRWREEYPYLTIGFAATSIGALVAFAVNDSGIVAAATMIGYVAPPILLLKLQESSVSHSP